MLSLATDSLFKLFKILEYRNHESLSRNGAALHKDIETLRDIAHHSKCESESLVKLAEQSRRDGRALKALSVLGTLYLPATFVAVSRVSTPDNGLTCLTACLEIQTMFSTSLIQTQSANVHENNTHFVLARQFWLFIALTAPLMLVTAGYMIWVEKR